MSRILRARASFLDGAWRGAGIGAGLLFVLGVGLLFADTLNQFAAGDLVSSSQINANFSMLKDDIDTNVTTLQNNIDSNFNLITSREVPVGTIVAWHKNLDARIPGIPAGWAECDESVLNDSESPIDGATLPDLNGQARFLRGGTTSGTNQANQLQAHTHNFWASNDNSGNGSPQLGHCAIQTLDRVKGCAGWAGPWDRQNVGGGAPAPLGNPIQNAGSGSETRPVNMSVVWIIRVK